MSIAHTVSNGAMKKDILCSDAIAQVLDQNESFLSKRFPRQYFYRLRCQLYCNRNSVLNIPHDSHVYICHLNTEVACFAILFFQVLIKVIMRNRKKKIITFGFPFYFQ